MRGVPGSGNGGGVPDSDRKRSLRFTLETDIVLLQEVGRHKPWASPHGKIRDTWEQIAASVTATINSSRDESEAARVDHGASKRRYDSLMEAFVKDELKSMRAKGSPDLYVRREELLTDLSLQLSQHHDQKLKVKKQANGVAAAAAAAAGVPSSIISSTTTSSSPSPSSMFSGVKHPRSEPSAALPDVKRQAPPRADFDHLDERDISGNRLKARELDLAERRLELDRARFESEREERSAFVASMQANTTLLMRLIDRLERPGANTISRDI